MPEREQLRTGWRGRATTVAMAALLFLLVTGLLIAYAPFSAVLQWNVLIHTAVGLLLLVPLALYTWWHWLDYRRYNLTDVVLLGYLAVAALALCLISGVVVTYQGAFSLATAALWRSIHLYSTWALLALSLPHVVLVFRRVKKKVGGRFARPVTLRTIAATIVGLVATVAAGWLYAGPSYNNTFPDDYNYLYGEDRPFAPSLAVTETGGAFDPDSLAGSETCGSAGCHTQILEEWKPSAHRYSAMDPLFMKVQAVMAEQNGAESTRYCGGCHDPISLFSGAKNIFEENLTGPQGFNEGISCLACHGVRETDLQGNANYVMSQPVAYLWQWQESGAGKFLSDFLIRTSPDHHNQLSKRMFKAPEYCAACHKQFIDEEVNRVGWVQLQNQYDNWKASHWFTEGDPEKTIECRECHMPLVESLDPARGDSVDHNRTAGDGMHRSHRFIAANTLVPAMLELDGWQEHNRLTELWLKGEYEIPEISDKWPKGPVVELALETPKVVTRGAKLPIRVVMTANKVGHDFPTGPLDIIQSWVEIHVVDKAGNEIFSSGTRDEQHFIEPGSFLFKAEPVDQYGNLIDRHNLWEMVGVRYRRALFPGYSDTVDYLVDCPTTIAPGQARDRAWSGKEERSFEIEASDSPDTYRITATLMYRKVDQFLINFLLGEDSGLTAPVIEMNRATATVEVLDRVSRVPSTTATSVAVGAGG